MDEKQIQGIQATQAITATAVSDDKTSLVQTITVTIKQDQLNVRLAQLQQQLAQANFQYQTQIATVNLQIADIQSKLDLFKVEKPVENPS